MGNHPKKIESPQASMILDQARVDCEATKGIWPNRILTDYLSDIVNCDPGRTALVAYRTDLGSEITLSYGDLDDRANCIAGNLAELGIGKGDVVSVQLPNWWEFVAIHLACLKIGAIINPLMPIFRARELEYMVGFAEARVLIVPRIFMKFNYEELGSQLVEQIETLEYLFVIGGKGENAFEKELLKAPDTPAPTSSPLNPDDVIQLLYTSGTTGQPKGVMHTSNTLLASTKQVIWRLDLGPSDVGFMPSPFAHQIGFTFGMMVPISLGIPLVIMDAWNPDTAIDLIERFRISYTGASTPFMVDMANVEGVENRDLDCFRRFLTAGAPILEPVVERVIRKLGVNMVPGWGMTEVTHATATIPFSSLSGSLTDGAALPGNEVRIIDQSGKQVPALEVGSLQFRGSTLFVGYFKKPELYDVDEYGWFDTGDLAWMDEKGNIRITGRSKDIIIRGGENIPVLEVESLISKMPEVADMALVSMPDERLGERGCLFVTANKDCLLTFRQMVSFLKSQNLAVQYIPERLEIIDEMPRTASGKIQKNILRDRAGELVEKGDMTFAKSK